MLYLLQDIRKPDLPPVWSLTNRPLTKLVDVYFQLMLANLASENTEITERPY